jgi:hypothetical protein
MKKNKEVNIWWQCLCSELSEPLATSLLTGILKLYMTIRFSYCAICMVIRFPN